MLVDGAPWYSVRPVQYERYANPTFLVVALEPSERCIGASAVDVTGAAIITGEDHERVVAQPTGS